MAPMTDEERLGQDLGLALFHTAGLFPNVRDRMAVVIAELRTMGHTITARPAPEPTYTIRLTEQQRRMTKEAILQKDNPRWIDSVEGVEAWKTLCNLIEDATPDPEPTYTRTFTEREWAYVINALDDYHAPGPLMPDGRLLVNHMQGQQPDSEPGA